MARDSNPIVRLGYPCWLRPLLWRHVAAITIGRRIYVKTGIAGEALERLLRHERVHVDQMQRLGLIRFVARYIREYASNRLRGLDASQAYRRISFEAEAFAAEEDKPL